MFKLERMTELREGNYKVEIFKEIDAEWVHEVLSVFIILHITDISFKVHINATIHIPSQDLRPSSWGTRQPFKNSN